MNYPLRALHPGYQKKYIPSLSSFNLMKQEIVLIYKNIEDLELDEKNSIKEQMKLNIDMIYGEGANESIFHKIDLGDRVVKIAYNNEVPIGIIIIKAELQKEETILVRDKGYIELKTFMIFNNKYKGKDIAYHMFEEVINVIKRAGSLQNSDGIYVSVSETFAANTLHFLQKIGFEQYKEKNNAYTEGNKEIFLFMPREINY